MVSTPNHDRLTLRFKAPPSWFETACGLLTMRQGLILRRRKPRAVSKDEAEDFGIFSILLKGALSSGGSTI